MFNKRIASVYIRRFHLAVVPAFILFMGLLFLLPSGCKKDENFDDDPSLRLLLYTDTVHFDTIFTKAGSATKNFKVKNPSSSPVRIDHIRLAGGDQSPFRINVDGRATSNFQNYELAGGDSLYIFVEVTIDPNNQSLPFIVTDSIEFRTNGNYQRVILDAYGQNAHFFENEIIPCNTTWTNDLPYVIYSSIGIQAGCKLTISPGVKIYSHRGSGILVAGTLEVNGSKEEPVVFQSDRLEEIYKDLPGQWYGIRFLPKSNNNIIRHAVIKNGLIGLQVDSLPLNQGEKNLEIEKSTVANMTVVGMVGYTSVIDARNVLFYNCGQFAFLGDLGGTYDFTNCTFDGYNTSLARRDPLIGLSNGDYKSTGGTVFSNDLSASFRNCIVWGSLEDEIALDKSGKGKADTLFRYNILKAQKMRYGGTNILNEDPKFVNGFDRDYHLDTLSPAIDAGIYFDPPYRVTEDLENRLRDSRPDIGCYEREQ